MGDTRFQRAYQRVARASDRHAALVALTDEETIEALAAASMAQDPLLANVLATAALNRVRRLRAALAHMDEGVVALAPDGRIQWLNAAAERLLRWRREEALGHDLHEFLHHRDAQGRAIDPAECAILGVARTGAPHRAEGDLFRDRDGRDFCAAYTCAPIPDGQGGIDGLVLAFQDCTPRMRAERELRESRERYKCLFDLSPDAIVEVDAEGVVHDANPAAVRLTGLPIDETRGHPFHEFLEGEDVEDTRRLFADVLRGERREREIRIRRRDGTTVIAHATGVPLVVQGQARGVYGILRPRSD